MQRFWASIFVVDSNGRQAGLDLHFNRHSGNQNHQFDGHFSQHIASMMGLPLIDSLLVVEAGDMGSSAAGTLLAHASRWVTPNRNKVGKAEIPAQLKHAYKAQKVI